MKKVNAIPVHTKGQHEAYSKLLNARNQLIKEREVYKIKLAEDLRKKKEEEERIRI